jgi:hypothetical protein
MSKAGFPKCRTCRYYEKGKCRLFIERVNNQITYAKVEDVRLNKSMCGPSALYWSDVNSDSDQTWYLGDPWSQE